MVAIISGNQLGLFNSSAATLAGASGTAATGRSGEKVFVNAANGNLILQDQDERLAALGLDLSLVRTYNSQGQVDGDNNDGWRIGVYQRVYNLTGTANTAGSTVTKTFGDGTDVVYTYNANLGKYVSHDGDGADDTLSWSGSQWAWTDGSSRVVETYNSAGQLINSKDIDNNTVAYTYTSSLLTRVTTAASGTFTQNVYLDYSGNNLSGIRTVEVNGSTTTTQTLTRYYYDANNRLKQVVVDLTPADNAVSLPDANADGYYETVNGQTYVTTYTYDSASGYVASITQSDGTSVSFTYQSLNGKYRVGSYTVATAEGNRTTNFAYTLYNTGAGVYQTTNVTDPLNRVTTYRHNSVGQLLAVLSPTVGTARVETDYGYDTAGNLVTISEDPAGLNRVTTMGYDANGNLNLTRDALGNTVTRVYDAANQLQTETRYLVPDPDGAGAGQPASPLTKRYVYDAKEHLRFMIDSDGRVTEHQYNAVGQRTLTRRFNGSGAFYNVGSTAPTEAQMLNWIAGTDTAYITKPDLTKIERLDYSYDFRGQVSTMTVWTTTDASGTGTGTASITRFIYDQRGNLLQTIEPRGGATVPSTVNTNTAYATTFAVDGLGRVLSTTEWISSADSVPFLRVTTTQYDDVGNRTVTTAANNLVTTSTYNKAGELTSVINTGPNSVAMGTIAYKYDANGRLKMATDPTGVRQFYLYDEAGRKVAEVDGDGSLTEYAYNKADQLVKTVRYADRLAAGAFVLGGANSLLDAAGNPTNVTLATLKSFLGTAVGRAKDQVSRNIYNNAGLLVYTLDAVGNLTENRYDGAKRLTDVIRYAIPLTLFDPAIDEVLPSSVTPSPTTDTSAEPDRRTRYFYDNDGHLAATFEAGGYVQGVLDVGGFMTEYRYDAAGHRSQEIRYANKTIATNWQTATLASLRPALDSSAADDPELDAITYYFYDGQGRQAGELDAEGYLTEIQYDLAGRVQQKTRYGAVLTYASNATVASLKAAVPATATRHTVSYIYDGLGRVQQESTIQGTASATDTVTTLYVYDQANNVTGITRAFGTSEARNPQKRYDALGRVMQELSAEGAGKLSGLSGTQIDTIWKQYGVTYTYDLAGRKLSATTQPNDAQTLTTYYYYDNDSRLRFTVNAAGEVTENRYDALGQLTDTLVYTNRISTSGLTGGLLTAALQTSLTPAADAVHDARTSYTYTLNGQVETVVTAQSAIDAVGSSNPTGFRTAYQYNAWGELYARMDTLSADLGRFYQYLHDSHGRMYVNFAGAFWGGYTISEKHDFDAFGRVTRATDANGNVTQFQYDRLGRTLTTIDALNGNRSMTYDAFDRVLTSRDATGNITTYAYNDATRTQTLTTPESIQVTTVKNRHGETFTVTAAGNTTTYLYDLNGNQKSVSDNLGTLESRAYDRAGREITSTDARGIVTKLDYDAANRALTRTVDPKSINATNDNPNGLNLATSYIYDGQGRVKQVAESNGRVTVNDYDRDGRLILVTVDPNGLNLRTRYAYDVEGKVLTVTQAFGTALPRRTQYIYDQLGRRTDDIVDPDLFDTAGNRTYAGLNLRTQYRYDDNGNMTRKIDARGNVTWYVYDANDRLTHTINALGEVAETTYDAEGRVLVTRGYANRVAKASLASFGDVVRASKSAATLTLQTSGAAAVPLQSAAADRIDQTVYDKDGRAVYSIDGIGDVTERTFDAAGRVTRTRGYARPVSVTALSASITVLQVQSLLTNAGNSVTTPATTDHLRWAAYDARGRAIFNVDGTGAVAQSTYDVDGNVTANTLYATRRATTVAMDLASLTSWVAGPDSDRASDTTATIANNPANQTTRFWYDTANRACFMLNAEGFLSETRYNDAAREMRTILYNKLDANNVPVKPTIVANATLADVRGALGVIDDALTNQVTLAHTDAAGRMDYRIDAENYRTNFFYDEAGNLIRSEQQLDQTTTPTYASVRHYFDAANREIATLTGENNLTINGYNALGLLEVRTVYDRAAAVPAAGANPVPVAGDTSHITRYTYDAVGRLTRESRELAAYTTALTSYTVPSGATWASIATAIYGNANVADELADALGFNPAAAPAANTALSGFPASLADAIYTDYRYDARGNRTDVIEGAASADARTTHYAYNSADQLTDTTEAYGTSQAITTHLILDAFGNVFQRTEAYGTSDSRLFEFQYDGMNRVTLATDALLRKTSTVYYASGMVRSRTVAYATSDARAEYYYYDRRNLQTLVINAAFEATQYAYDGAGNRTSVVNANVAPLTTTDEGYYLNWRARLGVVYKTGDAGATTTNLGTGKLATNLTAADKALLTARCTVSYAYDRDNRLVQMTDALDTVTRYYYDGANNKVGIIEAIGLGSQQRITSYSYYKDGRLKDVTFDPNGLNLKTSYTYDVLGNQATVTDANNVVRTNNFDKLGRLLNTTYGGMKTTYTYDRRGNALSMTTSAATGADARKTTYAYDLMDRRTLITDGEGFSTNIVYDAFDNQKSIITGQYLLTSGQPGYDAVKAAHAANLATTFVYDAGDRMTSMTDGAGDVTGYKYDTVDNRTAVIDGNANRVLTSNDAFAMAWRQRLLVVYWSGDQGATTTNLGQPKLVADLTAVDKQKINDAFTTSYTYDKANRMLTTRTPGGGQTIYTYDRVGNKKTEQQLQGGTYDSTGSLVNAVWLYKSFEYDGNNRLTAEILPYTADAPATRNEYVYDAVGNLLWQHDAVGTADARSRGMEYDLFNRKTADIDAEGGALLWSNDTAYIAKRRALGIVYTSGTNAGQGKLAADLTGAEKTALKQPHMTAYVYDKMGNRIKVTNALGQVVRYYYNSANQLTTMLGPDETIGGVRANVVTAYGYDFAGNQTSERVYLTRYTGTISDTAAPSVAAASDDRLTTSLYDAANRLRSRAISDGTISSPRTSRTDYVYDGAGHKLTEAKFAQTATYTVPSGATWDTVAATLYGGAGLGAQLQSLLGGITLTVGMTLSNLPGSFVLSNVTYFLNPLAVNAGGPRLERYTYDAAGRLSTFRDVDNSLTTYTYDGSNNRLSEMFTHSYANDPIAVRQTVYDYDQNNRRVKETFDPSGLNLVRTFAYDQVGNVIETTINAPVGGVTPRVAYAYDLANDQVSETKGVGTAAEAKTVFAYDRAGNRTSVTDPNALGSTPGTWGNTTTYVYDKNNRLVRETKPTAATYTISGTDRTLSPTTMNVYDNVGNLVQTVTINDNQSKSADISVDTSTTSYKTTRWYDAYGRVVAELKSDGALCEYDYNAAGDVTAKREYMVRLSASAHNPAVRPVPPADTATEKMRLTQYQYDIAGRLVKTVLPAIDVTQLGSTQTNNPSVTKTTGTVTSVSSIYNVYGEQVQTSDAAGNATYYYYDVKSRKVASFESLGADASGNIGNNALGYYTEWEYDAQSNVTLERRYVQTLSSVGVSPTTRPTLPTGSVPVDDAARVTKKVYDAASRLVSQIDPAIETYRPYDAADSASTAAYNPAQATTVIVNPVTNYTYDKAGNVISKTTGIARRASDGVLDSGKAVTEYYYYDTRGNRIGTVNGATRVAQTFSYDKNGNRMTEMRIYGSVPTDVNVATADFTTITAAILQRASDLAYSLSQAKVYQYDALNRLTSETDLVNPGTLTRAGDGTVSVTAYSTDDIVRNYKYDAAGNRTYSSDWRSTAANTSDPLYETTMSYDGLNRLTRSTTPDGTNTLFEYDAAGNLTRAYSGWTGANGSSPATIANVGIGDTLYVQWGGVVPANGLTAYIVYDTVARSDVTAYANRTMAQPVKSENTTSLGYNPPVGTTVYYRIVTVDAAGNMSWTAEESVVIPPRLTAISSALSGTSLVVTATFDAATTSPTLAYGAINTLASSVAFTRVGTTNTYTATIANYNAATMPAYAVHWNGTLTTQQGYFTPSSMSVDAIAISTAVSATTVSSGGATKYKLNLSTVLPNSLATTFSVVQVNYRLVGASAYQVATATTATTGNGKLTYAITLGDDTTPLDAGTYEMVIYGLRTNGTGTSLVTLDQLSCVAGTSVSTTAMSWIDRGVGNDQVAIVQGARSTAVRRDGRLLTDANAALSNGTVDYQVSYTQRASATHTFVRTSSNTASSGTTNLGVNLTLDLAESNTINAAGLRLAYRTATGGTAFPNDIAVAVTGTTTTNRTYAATLSGLAAGSYDLKLYYTDTQGREVIIEWVRALTLQSSVTLTGYSQTVLARDTGTLTSGSMSVTPGLYTGPIERLGLVAALPLTRTTTASAGAGGRLVDGTTSGYVTDYRYDAQNHKIASNENDGVWRDYGVDANGNIVDTRYRGSSSPGVLATYDARGRKIGQFDYFMRDPNNPSGPTVRPVERYEYDINDKLSKRTDANNGVWLTKYNAAGALVRERNAIVGTDIIHRTDVLGRETAVIKPSLGATFKYYDLAGNLVKESVVWNVSDPSPANRNDTGYGYDLFGRKMSETDARGMALLTKNVGPATGAGNLLTNFGSEYVQMRKALGIVYKSGDPGATSSNLGQGKLAADLTAADKALLKNAYTTWYEYDNRNLILRVRQAQGWHLAFDNSRLYQDERVHLLTTSTTPDANGIPVSNAEWARDIFSPNITTAQRQQLQNTFIPLYTTTYGYDSRGNRTSTSSGDLKSLTTTKYDGMGRVSETATYVTNAQLADGTMSNGWATTRRQYDAYGNLRIEIDPMNRTKFWEYGAFGRLQRETDEDGNIIEYQYDAYGRVMHEYDPVAKIDPRTGADLNAYRKNIWKTYDTIYDTRLHTVEDRAKGISTAASQMTTYTYTLTGNRESEYFAEYNADGTVATVRRNLKYTYSNAGELLRWVDSATQTNIAGTANVSGVHLNMDYDLDGNRIHVYTDNAADRLAHGGPNQSWDPEGKNTANSATFRHVDNLYTFDAAGRVGTVSDHGVVTDSYYYDAAGNRLGYGFFAPAPSSPITVYAYADGSAGIDANNRVSQARTIYRNGSGGTTRADRRQAWSYDALGNVLHYVAWDTTVNYDANPAIHYNDVWDAGTNKEHTVSTYNGLGLATVVSNSFDGGSASTSWARDTTNSYDFSGRVTKKTLKDYVSLGGAVKTTNYKYVAYFGDGREQTISASGTVNGQTTSYYDVNKVRNYVDYGNTGQLVNETSRFRADGEGHLTYKSHQNGGTGAADENWYFYANGSPVGEVSFSGGKIAVTLDSGAYRAIDNIGPTYPGANTTYSVREGDTLMIIASAVYGNPALWYVIADANALTGNESLHAGQELTIPNTTRSNEITAANHGVYKETDIVGSTLPQLKLSAPPKKNRCAMIAATIIAVIIAVVVTFVTYGVGSVASGALISAIGVQAGSIAAVGITVATFAAVGYAVSALGSLDKQMWQRLLGTRDKFDWKEIRNDARVGSISGVAQGAGAWANSLAKVGQLSTNLSWWTKSIEGVVQATSSLVDQELKDGKITSWVGIAANFLDGFGRNARRLSKATQGFEDAVEAGKISGATAANRLTAESAARVAARLETVSDYSGYLIPWANLGEQALREGGDLTKADFMTAVGRTLSKATLVGRRDEETVGERVFGSTLRVANNLFISSVLANTYGNDYAQSYLDREIGTEAGYFISGFVTDAMRKGFAPLDARVQARVAQREAERWAGREAAANGVAADGAAVINAARGLAGSPRNSTLGGGRSLYADAGAYSRDENGRIQGWEFLSPEERSGLLQYDSDAMVFEDERVYGERTVSGKPEVVVEDDGLDALMQAARSGANNAFDNVINWASNLADDVATGASDVADGVATGASYVYGGLRVLDSVAGDYLKYAVNALYPVDYLIAQPIDLATEWVTGRKSLGPYLTPAWQAMDRGASFRDVVHDIPMGTTYTYLHDTLAEVALETNYASNPNLRQYVDESAIFFNETRPFDLNLTVNDPPGTNVAPQDSFVWRTLTETLAGDDRQNATDKKVGFFNRDGVVRGDDGTLYSQKTNERYVNKAGEPTTPRQNINESFPKNNNAHLNALSITQEIGKFEYGAQVMDPIISLGGRDNFVRLGELRYEAMGRANFRARALTTGDPTGKGLKGYLDKPFGKNTINDTPFFDGWVGANAVYAEGATFTSGHDIEALNHWGFQWNLSTSAFVLAEAGIRTRSGKPPENAAQRNNSYAQTPTIMAAFTPLKFHLDARTPKIGSARYGTISAMASLDLNFFDRGRMGGVGLASMHIPGTKPGSLMPYAEWGGAGGNNLRGEKSLFSADLNVNLKNIFDDLWDWVGLRSMPNRGPGAN